MVVAGRRVGAGSIKRAATRAVAGGNLEVMSAWHFIGLLLAWKRIPVGIEVLPTDSKHHHSMSPQTHSRCFHNKWSLVKRKRERLMERKACSMSL